jgi:hypothetical protein
MPACVAASVTLRVNNADSRGGDVKRGNAILQDASAVIATIAAQLVDCPRSIGRSTYSTKGVLLVVTPNVAAPNCSISDAGIF